MNNDEINKYIHVEILQNTPAFGVCLKCGWTGAATICSQSSCNEQELHPYNMPDYCSDESPRRLLNEVVAAIDNDELVTMEIQRQVGYATFEIRATAEQIATACVEAHKALQQDRTSR